MNTATLITDSHEACVRARKHGDQALSEFIRLQQVQISRLKAGQCDPGLREGWVCFDCWKAYRDADLGSQVVERPSLYSPGEEIAICPECKHSRDLYPFSEAWTDIVAEARSSTARHRDKAVEIMAAICETYLEI